jgi:hypothetical protein
MATERLGGTVYRNVASERFRAISTEHGVFSDFFHSEYFCHTFCNLKSTKLFFQSLRLLGTHSLIYLKRRLLGTVLAIDVKTYYHTFMVIKTCKKILQVLT